MNIETVDDLFHQTMDLYQEKEFAQAYTLVSQNASRFPEAASQLTQWQMCMASLAGKSDVALAILEQALQSGLFYPEELLRDPDLAALQGNEPFETLVRESDKQFETIRAQAKPEMAIIEPQGLDSNVRHPLPLIVALHGNNSDIPRTRPFWKPVVEKGFLLALAQSSQIQGPGMYSWNDSSRAVLEVTQHVDTLIDGYPVDENRVLVGGFSMGGRIAVWLSLSGAVKTQGFIAIAPYIDDLEKWKDLIEPAKGSGLRGYIFAGELDTISGSKPQELAEMLQQAGIPCRLEIISGTGHAYPKDNAAALDRALEFILG